MFHYETQHLNPPTIGPEWRSVVSWLLNFSIERNSNPSKWNSSKFSNWKHYEKQHHRQTWQMLANKIHFLANLIFFERNLFIAAWQLNIDHSVGTLSGSMAEDQFITTVSLLSYCEPEEDEIHQAFEKDYLVWWQLSTLIDQSATHRVCYEHVSCYTSSITTTCFQKIRKFQREATRTAPSVEILSTNFGSLNFKSL